MNTKKPILIIGAGEATSLLIKEFKYQNNSHNIHGIVDDDESKQNTSIDNIKVIGTIKDISNLVKLNNIGEIIISIESITSQVINQVLEQIDPKKVMLRIIPTEKEVFFKSLSFSQTRNISPEDLLGRRSQDLDNKEIKDYLSNKSVLITGAGGSIGSELAQQLLFIPIKQLICISRGEYSLYSLQKILSKNNLLKIKIVYLLGNVQDINSMDHILKRYKPNIIFHAAAYKHVPMLENQEHEAIKNNVIATANLLKLANKHETSQFIFISTDKAVNPKSIMGASKRIAELLCEFKHQDTNMNVSTVRFGNVLGSRGSVVPLFLEQISQGGPVTVTHPHTTRYFMTIPEAAQLVITTATFSKGGEKFILDMGEAIKIDDLVKRMIKLLGFELHKDIKIKYTGLRPGEKLIEELTTTKEKVKKTPNERIFISKDNLTENKKAIEKKIQELILNINSLKPQEIRKCINEILPEFKDYNNQ